MKSLQSVDDSSSGSSRYALQSAGIEARSTPARRERRDGGADAPKTTDRPTGQLDQTDRHAGGVA